MPKGPRRPPPGWPAKLFLLVLLLSPIPSPAARPGEGILVVPFEDHSDFRGAWDLRQGVPQLLGELLRQGRAFEILPFDTLASPPAEAGEGGISRPGPTWSSAATSGASPSSASTWAAPSWGGYTS